MGSTTTIVAAKTIVVADDTAFVRDRFKAALERAGYQAVAVRTGPELMLTLRQTEPVDLLVLDLRLPQGNGLALLRAIRRLGRQPAVVVFSGTIASADEVRELDALGVSGYVNEYTSVRYIVPALAPHLSADHRNRRSSPRVGLGMPVSYRFGNTIAAALTLNLSQGGFAVRTTSLLAVGTTVRARFMLPGTKVEILADARVTWVDQRVGMGLQFTKVETTAQAAIDRFIRSRFFSNRKA